MPTTTGTSPWGRTKGPEAKSTQQGGDRLFNKRCSDFHRQKNEMGPCLPSYIKTNAKWIKDCNIKLGGGPGRDHRTLAWAGIFLDLSPKAEATIAKIDKEDHIKLRSSCRTKEAINIAKRQLWTGTDYLQATH